MFDPMFGIIRVVLLQSFGGRSRGAVQVCSCFLMSLFLCPVQALTADRVLSLVSGNGADTIKVRQGNSFEVEVRINDAAGVAAASFTVTYSTKNLTLSNITSDFFGAFDTQKIPTPNDQGYVTVDSVDYYRPLVINTLTSGSMVSAVRKDNGLGTNVALFILHFTSSGSTGIYPISIIPSVINNTDAGYSAEGEAIPLLVGIGENNTYPSLSVDAHECMAVVNPPLVDTDSDGIDDAWETTYAASIVAANPLSVFTGDGDYDHDGYSDYQEYLNAINGEKDSAGNVFDPTLLNAQCGTGFDPSTLIKNESEDSILEFIPAIISGVKRNK